jgi:hypothetical protein
LALLLLPIVGSIPSAAGQNALSNITASDIIDLVDNVTEGEEEIESPLPLEAIEDTSSSSPSAGDTTLINEVELNP